MRHLVIGIGEVGKALQKILNCNGYDKSFISRWPGDTLASENCPFVWAEHETDFADSAYDVIHIAFGYFNGFVDEIEKYVAQFKPSLVIIHSTVPVGTTKLCEDRVKERGVRVVHSPIRGVHPNLEGGIRTFVKYFGGIGAAEAAKIFEDLDIQVRVTDNAKNTEAGKLWDTTQYGVFIMLNKEIKEWCDKYGVDFDVVYTDFNQSYNEGYMKLGRPEVMRPVLKYMPGKIGGHCVLQNAKLFKSKSAKKLDRSK